MMRVKKNILDRFLRSTKVYRKTHSVFYSFVSGRLTSCGRYVSKMMKSCLRCQGRGRGIRPNAMTSDIFGHPPGVGARQRACFLTGIRIRVNAARPTLSIKPRGVKRRARKNDSGIPRVLDRNDIQRLVLKMQRTGYYPVRCG